MKFKAEINNSTLLKKGMKITLVVPDEEVNKVLGDLNNFIKRPIVVEFLVDANKVMEDMDKITPDQRSKIFALVKDIANHTGEDDTETIRREMARGYMRVSGVEEFSLSNCSKEVATGFIQYLLVMAFELGIPFSEDMRLKYNDDAYFHACIAKRVCCVCGRKASIHHSNHTGSRIGMGRNRKGVSNVGAGVLSLCEDKHHPEIHSMPEEEFFERYHVRPIILSAEDVLRYKL